MIQPQIWHYGLAAQHYAAFQVHGGPEATYFRTLIERSGQPALDLGCGTGRLLLGYVQDGLEVHGCDISADMLAECRASSAHAGIQVQLFQQAMHELDLHQRYRTIIACGVIGLGGERRLTMQAMQRCYDHLRPQGTFAFDYSPRWNDPPAWLSRLPERRAALPEEWPAATPRRSLADGYEHEVATRTVAMDPLYEVATRQIRVRLWQHGALLQEEIHTQKVEDYSHHELILMLERAGFVDITVTGDYCDDQATPDHTALVFIARKGRPG